MIMLKTCVVFSNKITYLYTMVSYSGFIAECIIFHITVIYRITYGLLWIQIFVTHEVIPQWFFMSDEVMCENNCQITSWMTKKSVFMVTHILFYFLHTILRPDGAQKPTKTIIICSFCHVRQGQTFLTWHCNVTTVKFVTSHECQVLALWCHIQRLFLQAQIGANVIFTSE